MVEQQLTSSSQKQESERMNVSQLTRENIMRSNLIHAIRWPKTTVTQNEYREQFQEALESIKNYRINKLS